ncbi:MAG: type II toxin-antitoxin system Phd/YefM family antitoxin [bacterium]|nr:type II toxin-antitoxin system Phd/YefM family antitoxin [bacterium]
MTLKINVHEAKTHFSRFLDRVGNGEEIIIAKAGKPIARLLPLHRKAGARIPGSARGKIKMSEDFDAPLPAAVIKEFEK